MSTRRWPALVTLALALACARRPADSSPVAEQLPPTPAAASATQPAPSDWSPPLLDGTVYDLVARLRDQNGAELGLDVFRGHPVLVTMFYAGCPSACPMLTRDLKRVERALPPPVRENVRVLMVSFDREHDTPEALARHMQNHQLDPARWKLASLDDESARELAGVLGIKYRKLDSGQYFHSSAILLLDEQGHPKARIEGLGKDPQSIVAALQQAGR